MENLTTRLRRDWWVALVLAVSVVGTLKHDERGYADPTVAAGVLIVVAVLPLLWRRSRPEAALLVTAAAVAAYFAFTYADGPVYLSIFLAVWGLARRRPVPAWLPHAWPTRLARLGAAGDAGRWPETLSCSRHLRLAPRTARRRYADQPWPSDADRKGAACTA